MLVTAIIFILVLSVLVFAHELGHFLTARFFRVKAEEFGFGFPPRAIGWYRNRAGRWRQVIGNRSVESLVTSEKEGVRPAERATIYSLNWLPIGGFVRIKGENGEGEKDDDSFVSRKIWQRVIIMAAGVIMNIVLAWLLFSAGYLIGLPQSTDTLGKGAIVSEARVMIAQVMPDSVAAQAGLEEGDAVLAVAGQPVATEKSLQEAIASHAGQEVELRIKRNSEERTVNVTPVSKDGGRAVIGVAIFSGGVVRYPFFPAFWEGAKTTGWTLKEIVVAFGSLFGQIFHGDDVSGQFAGPVGIASITGQAARLGFSYLLQFMALLSLNLAIINIIPFPALDGARILFLAIEKLKGKPVRREVEALIHNIGFILLIALIMFISYKDIAKLL